MFTRDACLRDAQQHDNAQVLVVPETKGSDRWLLGSVNGASSGGTFRQRSVSAGCWAAKTYHTLEKLPDGTAITNDVDITGSVAPPKPWAPGVSQSLQF